MPQEADRRIHRFPTFFISHGGGPWPWMLDQTGDAYDRLAAALRRMPEDAGDKPNGDADDLGALGGSRSSR